MKCPACAQIFVIKTDPKNAGESRAVLVCGLACARSSTFRCPRAACTIAEYEYVSGIRKKVRTYEASSAETMQGKSREQALALVNDPFCECAFCIRISWHIARYCTPPPPLPLLPPAVKLEHVGDDKRKAQSANERLAAIAEMQEARFADDAASNAALRLAARTQRHAAAKLAAEARELRFAGRLLPADAEDAAAAAAAIAARDLDRMAEGRLRSSGGGGAAASRESLAAAAAAARAPPADTSPGTGGRAPPLLLESATSVLSSSSSSRAAGALAAAQRLPIAPVPLAAGGGGASSAVAGARSAFPSSASAAAASAAQVGERLAALRASMAAGPALSQLLPPGRAAQLLSRPLVLSKPPLRAGAAPASGAAPTAGAKRRRPVDGGA